MDLSIIIINWNTIDYLENCLTSIYQQTYRLKFEVIVLDNASYDGSKQLIDQRYPQVKYIQSDQNLGFAKANNMAFLKSSGETILFLNPDTEILDKAINKMYDLLRKLPDAGAIGCKLLNSDLSIQTSCIQRFPTILNRTIDVDILKRKFPLLKFWGIYPLFEPKEIPVTVEVLAGACIMIKRQVFEKIGMFSTDYFMYAEDSDLGYKISKNGWQSYYLGNASIIHHLGKSLESKPESTFSTILKKESLRIYFKKHKGPFYAHLFNLSIAISAIFRMGLIIFLIPFSLFNNNKQLQTVTYEKWKTILAWALALRTVSSKTGS